MNYEESCRHDNCFVIVLLYYFDQQMITCRSLLANLCGLLYLAPGKMSADTRYSPNVGLMLIQRLRRWPSIKPPLVQRLAFAARVTAAPRRGGVLGQCMADASVQKTTQRRPVTHSQYWGYPDAVTAR